MDASNLIFIQKYRTLKFFGVKIKNCPVCVKNHLLGFET
jgi:hypothetical protein